MATFTPRETALISAFVKVRDEGELKLSFSSKGAAVQFRQKAYATRKAILARIEKEGLGLEYFDAVQDVSMQVTGEGEGPWGIRMVRSDETAGFDMLKQALGDGLLDVNGQVENGLQDRLRQAAARVGEGLGLGLPQERTPTGLGLESGNELAQARPANPYYTRG